MPLVENHPALRLRLLRELAQRLCWTSLTYGLFATLFALHLRPGVRGGGFFLCVLITVAGGMRTIFARRVITGRDIGHAGDRLIQATCILSLSFAVFVLYAFWHVHGQVIPELLLTLSIAGLSSTGASMLAPFPRLNRLNAYSQLAPLYVWSVFAFHRYGWLLEALIVIHAVAIAQAIRMNGAHIREMFIAQIKLETQSEDLRRARDAAENAASAKMRFLANMSHEIRTPLNGIVGLAEVLEQLALTGEQHAVLDDIHRSGSHLLSIVNDILDMAKVSSGKLSLECSPIDLSRLIRDVASPAAALAEARQLSFLLQAAPDLPRQVEGDPLRIRQVVSNLLSNAVKFTPSGEVRLAVEVPRPGWLRFAVSDTGIGLSAEQKDSLFQEFHQVDSSSTRRFGGSGLGLAISHRLVELMGGQLLVDSRLHHGSTFLVDLPLAAIEAAAGGVDTEAAPLSVLPAGLRVLVAEDNPVNRKVLVMLLSQAGVRVEVAENGRAAVERHQSFPYDLILMDCQMPELDGYEATSRIRALPGDAARVPIIGVTANAFAEDRERCLHTGMNGYVAKPLSRETLMAAVAPFLRLDDPVAP